MTNSDFIGLAASYGYAIGLLIVGEVLFKLFSLESELTRKFIHIGAGMWVFGVLVLFDNWQTGILPFATFILLNYLFYRYRIFGSIDNSSNSPGTVYFAISVTLLFGLFWRPDGPVDCAPIAVAGVMAMTWGDALAAYVGRRYGKHQYQVGSSIRSWEGSAAMLIASTAAIFLVLLLLPESSLSPLATPYGVRQALLTALAGGAIATLAEGISPHGTDNLSVPLIVAGVVWVIQTAY